MSVVGESSSPRTATPKDHVPFSAITDEPPYLAARLRSPLERNWSWTPPLRGSVHIVRDPYHANDRRECFPDRVAHERLVADDAILPQLDEETPRPGPSDVDGLRSPHPITAHNGVELLAQFGYKEAPRGTVIWTS